MSGNTQFLYSFSEDLPQPANPTMNALVKQPQAKQPQVTGQAMEAPITV